ncbi:MAG: cobalamin-binding protein [Deltaproteobacteria bacterium]|nr:cobalamin-binding protein [Deltaproteobacteria bacterium]
MTFALRNVPERIVCLTEEPTETLYLLGEQHRIVGISAYTERPPEARRDKPVVSAFIGGSVPKVAALEPDLVIGFSDIQGDLARDLIKASLPVLIFNQRTVQDILDVIVTLGRIVGAEDRARALVGGYIDRLHALQSRNEARTDRPRVYFEEWDEPTITAIAWVSELIELAGGRDVFADRAHRKLATERFVTHEEVIRSDPEIVIASWCGKDFDREAFLSRPGFAELAAARSDRIHEMDPAIILQPGPACLSAGLDWLEGHINR